MRKPETQNQSKHRSEQLRLLRCSRRRSRLLLRCSLRDLDLLPVAMKFQHLQQVIADVFVDLFLELARLGLA